MTIHFNCPHCNALYQVVRAEAGPETVDQQITCQACGAPLPSRQGSFVLEYFLLRKALPVDGRARPGSQAGETSCKLHSSLS